MGTYRKRFPDYYNEDKAEKSHNNPQLTSNIDNQLWPSHKSIPEVGKEEGRWYYGDICL